MQIQLACLSSYRRISVLLALGIVGLGSSLSAATLVQSRPFGLNTVSSTHDLNFVPFDGSLGTLESVSLNFETTLRHDLAIWNAGADGSAVDFTALLTGASLTVAGNQFSFADLAYGPASTPVLAPVSSSELIAEFTAGRTAFLGGLEPVFLRLFNPQPACSPKPECFHRWALVAWWISPLTPEHFPMPR